MKILVGLGNPGSKYSGTRHNIGFDFIDKLAQKYGIEIKEKKHKAVIGKGIINSQKVILAKPQTYMNLSGESVRAILDFYKLEPDSLIIIFDDISLDIGQLRIRLKGSAGGHNGIKSIISHLGSNEFKRIKLGVGEKPQGYELADYVLGHFSPEENSVLENTHKNAMEAVLLMLNDENEKAMNLYNKKIG